MFRNNESELINDFVLKTVDSLLSEICTRNAIIKNDIKLHILESDEVNAFAITIENTWIRLKKELSQVLFSAY